jgi:hypothetical protein
MGITISIDLKDQLQLISAEVRRADPVFGRVHYHLVKSMPRQCNPLCCGRGGLWHHSREKVGEDSCPPVSYPLRSVGQNASIGVNWRSHPLIAGTEGTGLGVYRLRLGHLKVRRPFLSLGSYDAILVQKVMLSYLRDSATSL